MPVPSAPPTIGTGARAAAGSVGPRLVMYVHPHCPCTRASLTELAAIVERAQARDAKLETEIVVVVAPGMDASWRKGAIVQAAEKLNGVRVRTDLDAAEARDVGAFTSGHTLLFDPSGRTIFYGGITRSRGHAGDNPGTRSIDDLLSDRTPETTSTPVFGCPLFTAEACRSIDDCRAEGLSKSELRIEPLPAVRN